MDNFNFDTVLCLKVLLAMLLIPSVGFAISVISRDKGRHISQRPGNAPGSDKNDI